MLFDLNFLLPTEHEWEWVDSWWWLCSCSYSLLCSQIVPNLLCIQLIFYFLYILCLPVDGLANLLNKDAFGLSLVNINSMFLFSSMFSLYVYASSSSNSLTPITFPLFGIGLLINWWRLRLSLMSSLNSLIRSPDWLITWSI